MLIALWILNALLALAFGSTGALKLTRSREQLRSRGLGWVDDYSAGQVKAIGVAEVVGALGLILPLITGIATMIAPFAAFGLACIMGGAVFTHMRRGESPFPPLILGLLALASAVLGTLVARS